MITVIAPARLHLTLIDLAEIGYRRNGGIGFSIDGLDSIFDFKSSNKIDLSQLAGANFTTSEIVRIENVLNELRSTTNKGGLLLSKVNCPPRHSGFGSGTTATLAAVEAYCMLNEVAVTRDEIVNYSGRGGTSGIGINSYFDGGFILDGGRKFDRSSLSSSDMINRPSALPLKLLRLEMPDWPVGILIPHDISSPTLEQEQTLFTEILPISMPEVHATTYHSIFGVVSAVVENDFSTFCRAVDELQQCAWKRNEILLHGNKMAMYFEALKECGVSGVGMSSVGPAIYFFAADFSKVFDEVRRRFPLSVLRKVNAANSGRVVIND